jgi:glyoxylase-like metal-dependent hydrolase (beta-lactamase superfamily II)
VTRKWCGAANCRNFAPSLFCEVTPSSLVRRDGVPAPAPGTYEPGAFTGVIRQPQSKEEYLAARTAAAACGFGAIRIEKPKAKLAAEEKGSPWKTWPKQLEAGVWAIGQPSLKNYGALAYFIERPGGGILVDVPKPSEELFEWLEAHGGVRWLFLTHRDHAQLHGEIKARFPECRRIIGEKDVNRRQNPYMDATDMVESQLPNEIVPRTLEGEPIPLDELQDADVAILPQPGHTPGTLCLLVRGRFLFTGDHLAHSLVRGHMIAHRLQCWGDWEEQTRSVARLGEWADAGKLRFQWVLPGHGEWQCLEGDGSAAATAGHLRQLIEWMRDQPAGNVPLLRWIPFVMSRAKPSARFGRLVMALGGAAKDAWLLPRASRIYLTDYESKRPKARLRRFSALMVVALSALILAAFFVSRGT